MSNDTSISNIFELLTNESDKSEEVKSGIIYLKVKDQIIYGDLNVLAFEIKSQLRKADKQELLYSFPEIRNLCIKETIEKEFCRPKER